MTMCYCTGACRETGVCPNASVTPNVWPPNSNLPLPGDGFTFVQQGWQCPVCKNVYSPVMVQCLNCPQNTVTINNTHTTVIQSPKTSSDDQEKQ